MSIEKKNKNIPRSFQMKTIFYKQVEEGGDYQALSTATVYKISSNTFSDCMTKCLVRNNNKYNLCVTHCNNNN